MEKWRHLEPKQVMTKMTEIMDDYKDNIPENLYIEMMNATKVIYDSLGIKEDNEVIAREAVIDPIKIKYEVIATMELLQRVKRDMNDFKHVKRISKAFKEYVIRSYCKHKGVRIPMHTWDCLMYYGYAPNPEITEKVMYESYKTHHNEKLTRYEQMYNLQMKKLEKMLSIVHK